MKNSNNHTPQTGFFTFTLPLLTVVLAAPCLHAQELQEPVTSAPAVVKAPVQAEAPVPADHLRRIAIGEALPDFTVTTSEGKVIHKADYAKRALVLVYLSAEQRNSEHAAADAARILNKYADKNIELLFVSADIVHAEYFQAYFKEAHIQATLGFDSGHELYSKLGLIVFPSTLVVGKDGKLDHVILTYRSDYSNLLDSFVGHALGLMSSETLEQRLVAPSMSRSSPKTQAQRHREAARLLRDNELYKGAEQELLLAAGLDAKSVPIRLDLADLYLQLERYEEAEAILDAILATDADHRSARLLLGILRFQTDKLDEAEEILLSALVMNPNPERTHYYLGQIYEQRGDLAQAVEHYRAALDRLVVK